MNEFDKDFVISKSDLKKDEYIVVRYRFETAGDFESAAIALAKEQSFSTIEDPEKEKKLMKSITMENMVDMDIKNQNKKDLDRKENVLILKIKFQSLLSRKYTL